MVFRMNSSGASSGDAPTHRYVPGATPRPLPMPPKQVPLPPDFAQKGFDSLNKVQAVEMFRREAVKVEALHRRVEALEDALEQSHRREEDLLGLLRRWRGESRKP